MSTINFIKAHLLIALLTVLLINSNSESATQYNFSSEEVPLNSVVIDIEKRKEDNFMVSLCGTNEVPAVDTNATGEAIVQISNDGNYISYKLIVKDLENVRTAHFHMAPAGENGDVVAFLFSGDVANQNGILSEGTITAEDLLGPLEGEGLDALIQEILKGRIYVNVHTADFPSGAIRGQL